MKSISIALSLTLASISMTANAGHHEERAVCPDYLKQTMRKLNSKDTVNLCELTKGKTVLITNTASNCGFTGQFKELEALHKQYKNKGLVVLGFPSNDFRQEESDEKDTAKICYINYGVTFTMLEKSPIKGKKANPIFAHLAKESSAPKWNFNKYVVTNNGTKIQHFNSNVKPNSKDIISAIKADLSIN